MKTLSLISRCDTLSPAAFRHYYEHHHCWLAMKHFPFRRYIRNHVIAAPGGLDFDCVSQFAMAPGFQSGDVMGSGSRAMMLEDERKFMKPECIRVARVREQTLVGATAAPMAAECRRLVLMVERDGAAQTDFQAAVEAAAHALVARSSGIRHASLDTVHPDADFPYDALVWLSMEEGRELHRPQLEQLPGRVTPVTVSTHATPEAILARQFEAYVP
ncbi:EthD domain-containing protein [Marinobacter sp. X15-166B]|uniref:EthD domain-containing protein n=1 Tax=Marinobacter sp. X15-166B TaxID=1897620 RepID=UPI0013014255|nr:EthD domain-containing protein [Marinobacter sp. X15-166B]